MLSIGERRGKSSLFASTGLLCTHLGLELQLLVIFVIDNSIHC